MSARSLISAAALVLGLAIGAALLGCGAYTLGGWDWEGADGTGFECRDCHAEYDVLPEGWDVDYV